MGQDQRISRYIEECRRRGISVEPPDINNSERKFTVVDGKIIYGLGAVKNVGDGFIKSITQSREKNGPFTSLLDFCERVDNISRRAVLSLIKAGAFDSFGVDRGTLLLNAYEFISRGQEMKKIRLSGQESFFGAAEFEQPEMELEKAEPLDPDVILSMEKEVLGIYLSGHPLREYQELLERSTAFNLGLTESFEDLSRIAPDQSYVYVGGLLENTRTQLTKVGDQMLFGRLEDQFGGLDLVFFPKVYEKYRSLIRDDLPVLIYGKLCYDEEMNVSVVVDTMQTLEEVKHKRQFNSRPFQSFSNQVTKGQNALTIHLSDFSQKPLLNNIKRVLRTSPGSVPVILYFEKENKRFKASDKLNVNPTDELINKLNDVLNQ